MAISALCVAPNVINEAGRSVHGAFSVRAWRLGMLWLLSREVGIDRWGAIPTETSITHFSAKTSSVLWASLLKPTA